MAAGHTEQLPIKITEAIVGFAELHAVDPISADHEDAQDYDLHDVYETVYQTEGRVLGKAVGTLVANQHIFFPDEDSVMIEGRRIELYAAGDSDADEPVVAIDCSKPIGSDTFELEFHFPDEHFADMTIKAARQLVGELVELEEDIVEKARLSSVAEQFISLADKLTTRPTNQDDEYSQDEEIVRAQVGDYPLEDFCFRDVRSMRVYSFDWDSSDETAAEFKLYSDPDCLREVISVSASFDVKTGQGEVLTIKKGDSELTAMGSVSSVRALKDIQALTLAQPTAA